MSTVERKAMTTKIEITHQGGKDVRVITYEKNAKGPDTKAQEDVLESEGESTIQYLHDGQYVVVTEE